jgi:tRNA wybutosine-synthesizing protein 2
MVDTPFGQIKKSLSEEIPSDLISKIPDKWEKVGDIGIIKLHSDLDNYSELIGEIYAEILQCKTILNDVGGITGIYREPENKIIYGSNDTVTIHKENGIRFKLDPQRVMFSSGNMDERIRMATISNEKEIVVDLFAGIGYFTLPIAVYSKPKKIFACELNPVAYDFLCENIVLNDVSKIVEPLKGDNRDVAPENIADRVVMGYIENTLDFLPVAIECLKDNVGVIHYHEVCPDESFPDHLFGNITNVAVEFDRKAELLTHKHIKSYAPGVSHVVLDVRLG